MTTPKEALEAARKCIWSGGDSLATVAIIDEALASLQGEDAVERVAQTAQAFWQSPSGRSWIECCEKLPQQAEWFRRLARTILATGLVPDEAAIRADEREKCARVADERASSYDNEWNRKLGKSNDLVEACEDIAAAIRSGGGE